MCENECLPSITSLNKDNFIYLILAKYYILNFLKLKRRENINNLMIYMGDVVEFKC